MTYGAPDRLLRAIIDVPADQLIHFSLPWPPTTNNLFSTFGNRRIPTEKAKTYADQVGGHILLQHVPRFLLKGPVGIAIIARPPDNVRRDLDNLLKAPLDGLKKAGVIEDDSQFDSVYIVRGERLTGGILNITLWPMDVSRYPSRRSVARDDNPTKAAVAAGRSP